MYGPAPPRSKKTSIVRARTGCKSCRKRRTKCDEQKPSCGTCVRLGKTCEKVSPKLQFRNLTYPSTHHNGAGTSPCRASSAPNAVGENVQPTGSDVSSWVSTSLESCLTDPYPRLDQGYGTELWTIPSTVTPHRDPVQPVLFYMDVWREQCLPALHVAFHQLEALQGSPMLIENAMIALSACRLSRALPQRKLSSPSSASRLSFRPNLDHESMSHERYGVVMRNMARWHHREFDANPALAFAVLVLFCYLESSMGNFREFRVHSEGLKSLVQCCSDRLACRQGSGLLAAWVEVEMQNWWRRVYFGTPDFHRDHGTLLLPPQLEAVLNDMNHRRASVLLILCESHRLNTAAALSCWNDPKPWTNSDNSPGDNFKTGCTLDGYVVSLKAQSDALDDWFGRLTPSDLPELWQDGGDNSGPGLKELGRQPLRFKHHCSAMDFAYYATARVMQCTGPLESLNGGVQQDDAATTAYDEAEAWISILLRIAAGISWDQCTRLNVYTIGFTSLLLACALRSRDLATGLWIQEWLDERLKSDSFEEGNFPVFQILDTVRLVNLERMEGRDAFLLFQGVDDRGGRGKLGSYHSQLLESLHVYGRWRATGELYSYLKTL